MVTIIRVRRCFIALVILALGGSLLAEAEVETADAEPLPLELRNASVEARASGRDLLVFFQGPSSNEGCKKMNEETFGSQEFRSFLAKEFVVLAIPAPGDLERDNAQKASYRSLLRALKVSAYPVIVLATDEVEVYGKELVYNPDSAALRKIIGTLKLQKSLLAESKKICTTVNIEDPIASASRLSALLEGLSEEVAILYHWDLIEHLAVLDETKETGLKANWDQKKYKIFTVSKFNQIYTSISNDLWNLKSPTERAAFIDEIITAEKLSDSVAQLMEFQKFRVWIGTDSAKARDALTRAYELAPETPAAIRINNFIQRLDKHLEKPAAESIDQ